MNYQEPSFDRLLKELPIEVKPDLVKVERFPEMMEGAYNVPRLFGRPSVKKSYNEKGFSDHFPISLVLQEV